MIDQHFAVNRIGMIEIRLPAGISDDSINHEEVMETGAKVAATFKELLRRVITKIN